MEILNWLAATCILVYGAIVFGASLDVPNCKQGYVASFNLPKVGWVCVSGYKP